MKSGSFLCLLQKRLRVCLIVNRCLPRVLFIMSCLWHLIGFYIIFSTIISPLRGCISFIHLSSTPFIFSLLPYAFIPLYPIPSHFFPSFIFIGVHYYFVIQFILLLQMPLSWGVYPLCLNAGNGNYEY